MGAYTKATNFWKMWAKMKEKAINLIDLKVSQRTAKDFPNVILYKRRKNKSIAVHKRLRKLALRKSKSTLCK